MIKLLPGPENILQKQFPNGVTVLIHENPWSRTAAINGSLFGGACLEPEEKIGLASFVTASLTAGIRTGDFGLIDEYLERTGSVLTFRSDPDSIRFNGNCLCEDLPGLLSVLKKALDEPVFPEDYLEILKQQAVLRNGRLVSCPDTAEIAYNWFSTILWGEEHPYGRPKFGDEETTPGITRDDLLDFHRRFFGPKKMILSISGNLRGQEVMARCEEIFGNWTKAQEVMDEKALFPSGERWEDECIRFHTDVIAASDISLVIGTFGPAVNDPDFLSAKLGNCILGEFGSMGRVGQVVREEHGLAYTVFSTLDSRKYGGYWSVDAEMDPKNLAEAGDLIIDELRRFTSEPVTTEELEDAKEWYISSLPLDFRTNREKALLIHSLAFYHRGLDYYHRLPEYISTVTPETILETARKWINLKELIISTAGFRDESKNQGWW